MTWRWRGTAILVATLGIGLAPGPARAQGQANAAAAEAAFQAGRKLMEQKRYADACPKFATSQKIAPAIGTLLNLADCYEKNDQLATAWTKFHEAIALAQRLGRSNREQTARERADKLEPRLIRLSILARASGIEVKLDGAAIEPAVLGTPIPVDAGKHVVEANAKGKKTFTKEVDLNEREKTPSVDIPPLEDDGKEPAGAKDNKDKPQTDDQRDNVTPPPTTRRSTWSTQKTLGLIAGGAGVLALGAGTFLGLRTQSTWKDAQQHCNGTACDQEGVDLGQQAHSTGNIATVVFIAGGVFVAGGVVLFLTAAPPKTAAGAGARQGTSFHVGVGPGSGFVGGSF